MKALELNNVAIRYPDSGRPEGFLLAASEVSLALNRGDIGCLLGPSGCGKTSLLRAVAGFVPIAEGEIRINGELMAAVHSHVPPEKRKVGVVFQDYALFPHLTVIENIRFGLTKGKRHANAEVLARANDMLHLVGLRQQSDRYPHELSGGQQQRVALARALAPQPDLVLLDEPFSNLDIALRDRLAREIRDILRQTQTTAILVTHDQHEAFAVADQVGVIFDGQLTQWANPYQLYHEPNSAAVARFVGEGAFITGSQVGHQVQTLLGALPLSACCCNDCEPFGDVRVLLRPDDVVHDDASPLKARVVRKAFRGADFLYTLELDNGEQILSLVPSHHDHALDEQIGIRLEADHVVTFSQAEPAQPF
ncbi:MAG: ABC transporter ATP-binding protein [Betaproteobacteria bacterium]|nr:ABC transporter ATP-binding protein [Betaproteobacteria bacterium]